MEIKDQTREKYEVSPKYFRSTHVCLTIRKCVEDTRRAETAVAGCGVHPNLNLVWRGPAEVRQHHLVSVTLCVMALIFTAALLWHNHKSQLQLQIHRACTHQYRLRYKEFDNTTDIFLD